MKAADLPLLTSVSDPTIHPEGDRVVVSVVRPDFAADDYVGQLWTVFLAGMPRPRLLTRGHRDAAPRFSPDGRLVAFLRSSPATPAQLYVMASGGGEPVPVTDAALGVTEYCWSPDSTSLAYIARVPEAGRYGTVPGLAAEAEPPRIVTTLHYRSNGIGYIADRRAHVFLVRAPDPWAEPVPAVVPSAVVPAEPGAAPSGLPRGAANVRQLTGGDFDHTGLAFSPDGAALLTISARHPGRDEDLRSELVVIAPGPVAGGPGAREQIVLAAAADLTIAQIGWGQDGSIVFLAQAVGPDGRDFVARSGTLYRLGPGPNPPVRLTDPDEFDLEARAALSLTRDGAVLAVNRARGRAQLIRVASDGTVTHLTRGDVVVSGHDSRDGLVVTTYRDALTEGDLALVGPMDARRLTDFSAALRETGLATARELTVPAGDGYPVHGWVYSPSGRGPHPLLLLIHGGPFAQATVAGSEEIQVLVDAGYAVAECNPRGSAGYGQAHGRAIRRRLGTVDQSDVLDFLAGALAADPALDPGRLGLMGGSYGGFLAAWITAHDQRFAAVIVERGFLDPETFLGTSDIGDFFVDEYLGLSRQLRLAQSPLEAVGRVSTPTLLIHSEQDQRCPLSQAERYYFALKRGGVTAELAIFPGEDHELNRGGTPRHRLQRLHLILDWWDRYLPVTPGKPSARR